MISLSTCLSNPSRLFHYLPKKPQNFTQNPQNPGPHPNPIQLGHPLEKKEKRKKAIHPIGLGRVSYGPTHPLPSPSRLDRVDLNSDEFYYTVEHAPPTTRATSLQCAYWLELGI